MHFNEVIRSAAKESGTKMYELAESVGSNYVALNSAMGHKQRINIVRYADLMNACGYRLVAMPKSKKLPKGCFEIDGSKKEE